MPTILVERSNRIATITLNRPEKLNAFAGSMRDDLLAGLESIAADDSVRAVVVTGAGRGFCAGGDVGYMAELQANDDRESFRALLDAGARIVQRVREMPQLVIASVNGVAAGAGCNLALACDYRIAADSATFSQAFVKIGLHPDWGGTWSLPRLVGPTRAMEILATGRPVSADEALSLGMVDRVVGSDDLGRETTILAETIAQGPANAIADIKRAVWASLSSHLEEQLEREATNQLRAFSSKDGREGVSSFLERRKPDFS